MENTQQALLETARSFERLLKQMGGKALTLAPTGVAPVGPGGIFGVCGLDQQVVNLALAPQGIDTLLPVFPSVFIAPQYASITGFGAEVGDDPNGVCDDCPSVGMQSCIQTAPLGRYCYETEEMEINEIITRINRGVFTDLQVLGSIFGERQFPAADDTAGWINLATQSEMIKVGVNFQRTLAQQVYVGNPANNSVGGGYMEFNGMDILINTGKVDTITGTPCAALDSDLKDFNYNNVCGVAPDIVEYISMMELFLRHKAERQGLAPATWAISMRPELWQELTACWPCKYLTNRCVTATPTATSVINDTANVDLRDAMRNGMFLTVNGRNIPVVTDDGIFEDNSTNSDNLAMGEFASDIYFIPLRARNVPVTYWEHLDYSKAAPEVSALKGMQQFWWTDDGRFMWNVQQQSWCFKLQAKIQPRIVMKTPQLAGRIENVMYTPLQHLASPFPEDPYFAKGGVDERSKYWEYLNR